MTDRALTPPSQTPSANSTATSLPATPRGRRPLRPRTPGNSINRPIPPCISSPFPPRTPRSKIIPTTPSSTTTACSSNAADFITVKVHTAKCSECDKRNMDTMRRCPGCTFQICKPCYDRREKAGRNLAHGNMQSSATPMTSGGLNVVRRRPASVVGTPGMLRTLGQDAQKASKSVKNNNNNNKEGNIASTPKKRTAKPKKKVFSSDESSSDEFVPDSDSPTSAKRLRTLQSTPTATSIHSSRKQATPSTPQKHYHTALARTDTDISIDLSTSVGFRPSTLTYDILMQAVGVNTPENPYQQHLLSRQNPIVTNPVIAIPEIIKRGFQPRSRATKTLKNIRQQASHASDTKKEEHEQPSTTTSSPSPPPPQTIRHFISSKVATYHQNTTLDTDEKDELLSTAKEAGRKWAVQLFRSLPMTTLKSATRGLDMRLEDMEETKKNELEKLIEDVLARKLRELLDEEGAT